ncbi:class I SAM-dependent RNA methyltransferase [Maritimibacter sp. 55A14]|uniref:class I SAM-dependent RNA methyltransferase n=1 Tax=Maritimibacter sp. 55A14 TaxID=2174844 RepID=UPI000D614B94|nr:class I SAM-dependent RNA methyltransferase [Maritimibacter sp. 55A14]PWE30035.1 class I SAM-dependent RNA methyltransferase [Maritimibacter sp. 55A14]
MKVTVERLGHLGDGVGDGPVFVPRALPGEVVEGVVEDGRMLAPRILTPSPLRVRPTCPHYNGCGACAVQHAADDFVADWKQDVLRAALAAQGLEAPLRPIAISPPGSRRRAVLAGRRTKKGAIVGFHGRASETLVAVPFCRVLHSHLLAVLPFCERLVQVGGSRKGELGFAVTATEGGVDMAVTGGKPADLALRAALAAGAEEADLARLSWNGELVAERRPPVVHFGGVAVVPPPGAFLQATAQGEAALTAAVTEAVGGAARVLDLFAGCGTFSLPLAAQAEVHAVEGDAALTAALDAGWRHGAGLRPVTAETRDLFRDPLLPAELAGCGAVVIDPPRAGAEAQMRALAASDIARIAAVSCNPASFARDARVLSEAGFRLDWVQVVDQFRWSPHVELVALLTRGHKRA